MLIGTMLGLVNFIIALLLGPETRGTWRWCPISSSAGFSPTFLFLLVFRTLLGIGMGAEWPAGAALATESWPARSRGLMCLGPARLLGARLS